MIRTASLCKVLLSVLILSVLLSSALLLTPVKVHALCATVKIEIRQELTLERQAFDAHMRINNGLAAISIDDVTVKVFFSDEDGEPVLASSDPDDTNALFFIRVDSMENIDNVDGTGSVAPETSADIHWLIIPAPGASNGLESGTFYYVGANLTYTAAGETETIEVTPDYIFVKPMPQLVLDYFLPTDVYGDDAWTDTVEAPVPFTLGLRVSNQGFGYTRSLKVESAQPKIVENEMGLLIGFRIDGSTVNGQPATDSLLADLGDIAPNGAGTARWIMSCTQSGRFVDFSAEFSHADELGGKLTSLIAQDDVRTHYLVGDVLVDAEGRDGIEDFLAKDNDVYRIYESDATISDVTDQSAGASLSNAQGGYQLTTPVTTGFMYAQVADPFNGGMLVNEAIRSDGKRIKSANIWFSKTRAGSGPWQYFLNIFDHNTPGQYTLVFENTAAVPQPPVINYIPERTRVEGQQLSFLVEASDPNGTIPSLTAERLPIGATFTDNGDGSGIFDWTPGMSQAGLYTVKFVASDGVLEASRQARIRIFSQDDSDGDGMLDSWELQHFGTLDRDGSGDFDGDGISDLDEYLNGFDPEIAQSVPSVPEIIAPLNGEHVDQLTPALEIANSIDPEGDACTYTFEVYADKTFKTVVASQADVVPQTGTTTWSVPLTLEDNTVYHWRVKASDATGSSNWAYGHLFTDTLNDPPGAPIVSYPADYGVADTQTPLLEVINATDIDGHTLSYTMEVYADSSMSIPVTSAHQIASDNSGRTSWLVDTALNDGQWYYWRAIAVDEHGAQSASASAAFQVNTTNGIPNAPAIHQPADNAESVVTFIDLVVDNAGDPDGDLLTYLFELDTEPTFNSPDKLSSGELLPADETTTWSLDALRDNTRYFWRVKTNDGLADSYWTYGTFFVNTLNEAPPVPELKNPGLGAWVNTQVPQLAGHPVSDIDGDALAYRFEIYTDPDLTEPAGYAEVEDPVWPGVSTLNSGTWYYWRVQAVDQHGIPSEWSALGSFFVKVNGVNLAPHFSFLEPSAAIATNAQGILIRWADIDPDSNAAISFYYDTDESGADGILFAENIEEDPDGANDYYSWDISAIEGTYYIYAVIADHFSSTTVYCPAAVTIDRTPPVVTVDPPGGTYGAPQSVVLSADKSAQIYYTIDGTTPDINSQLYGTPITISEETTLTCMAIDTVGNQSTAVSEAYSFQTTEITVTVGTDKDRILNGVRVYAFTEAGAYTGRYATTDGMGQVHFNPDDFTAGSYQFRVDYLGGQFWSTAVTLPDTRAIDVVIAEEAVVVSVTTASGPAVGVRVYLFSASGAYLGLYETTDDNGEGLFMLPVGREFQFRADLMGNQYWSGTTTITSGGTNSLPLETGGGKLSVAVNKSPTEPLAGLKVYLFKTTGTYLGQNATTNSDGAVDFDVPQGDYKVRVDYMGYQFWSDDTTVSTDTMATVTIAHQQITVAVESRFNQVIAPLTGVPIYLFRPSGSYLGLSRTTDDQGQAFFDLPQKAYKVRADYLMRQFWSDEFTWQDPTVSVPLSEAQITVTGGGQPLEGLRVYAFSATSSYLGLNAGTDGDGQVLFQLPEGEYLFRADYQGNQFWSAVSDLSADQTHAIGISTGGGTFAFSVITDTGDPLSGVNCYVFDENQAYLGLRGTTDTSGEATFDLADGAYRIRVDYLGNQFWSDVITVPDTMAAQHIIAHTDVEVTFETAAGPVPDARIYLFGATDNYLGCCLETDSGGMARFNLPAGMDVMFRADLLGSRYWSELLTVPDTGPAATTIHAGGGRLTLTVEDGSGNPMPDLKSYLFNPAGTYLGMQQTTSADGTAAFDLPEADYKIRVDYLGGSYWTDIITVDQDLGVTLPIGHQLVTLTVQGRFAGVDDPLSGVRIYLFTSTGTYLDRYADSDASGQVQFNLPARDYTARADYMGDHFWSGVFNSQNTDITIPMADAQITVTGAGLPQSGIRVYLFSDTGAYLGLNAATDGNGNLLFRVPANAYQARADYQSNQYWSGVQPLDPDVVNPVVISVGGGTFAVDVTREASAPMPGVRCYVFDETGAYVGLYGATNAQGQAFFDLADGQFQFRIDYLGYRYWSSVVTVPTALEAEVQIPHQDITLTLTGRYLGSTDPLDGQRLYLFTPGGSYMGFSQTTGSDGTAVFQLPDQEYQVRADYLGNRYWSDIFHSQDMTIAIAQGAVELHAHRSGTGANAVRVYLFNTDDTYLGRYQVTDIDGWTTFILPEGTYRFRVDADGIQRWSADITITADQSQIVEVDLD